MRLGRSSVALAALSSALVLPLSLVLVCSQAEAAAEGKQLKNNALKTCAAAGLVKDSQGHQEVYLEECKPNNTYQQWTYNLNSKQLKNDALKTCAAAGLVKDSQGHQEVYLEECKPNNTYQQWTL